MQPKPDRLVELAGITWSFSDERPGNGVALGCRVQFAVEGFIVQASWLQNNGDDGCHAAYLFQPAGTMQRIAAWKPSVAGTADSPWSWVRRNLKPAWHVEAGTVYEWLIWRASKIYAYAHSVLDTVPLTSGPITILNNNFDGVSSAGLWDYNVLGDTALGRGEGTLYGIDLAFQPLNV